MATLGDLLPAAVLPGDPPRRGQAAIDYVGGRREMRMALSGLQGPPNRKAYPDAASYDAARKRWGAASRAVERHTTTAAQRRSEWRYTADQRRRVLQAGIRRRLAVLRRGAFMRVRGTVRAYPGSTDVRVRTMPTGPAQWMPAGVMGAVLDQLATDVDAAAELLWREFCRRYFRGDDDESVAAEQAELVLEEDAEIEDVTWLRLWGRTESEPT